MLKCPHWSIQVPNQLFNLLRTDKIEREKNNFKVVYPGIFYSLISYSKAEKFNITSFFFTALNNESHLIPDDRASVGYNTIPKPLVTWPKVSVSTRPHILVSVMFSQIPWFENAKKVLKRLLPTVTCTQRLGTCQRKAYTLGTLLFLSKRPSSARVFRQWTNYIQSFP